VGNFYIAKKIKSSTLQDALNIQLHTSTEITKKKILKDERRKEEIRERMDWEEDFRLCTKDCNRWVGA
jgi:hypothetical protein